MTARGLVECAQNGNLITYASPEQMAASKTLVKIAAQVFNACMKDTANSQHTGETREPTLLPQMSCLLLEGLQCSV